MTVGAGRIQLHDPKSRQHEYPRRAPERGVSVRHVMNAPNVDQFYTSGCVGFSGTNLLNCAKALPVRRAFNRIMEASSGEDRYPSEYLDNKDGLANYSGSTLYDPFEGSYPPTDEGSSALGLMKYWKDHLKIISEYQWTFTFDAFLAALQKRPVLLGTWWYEQMNTPDEQGVVTPSGRQLGGHEYLANALLWERKLIGCENSWGESWGRRGRFYLSFDAAEALILDGGDVAVPILR